MTSNQIGRYAAILACSESKHHYNGRVGFWKLLGWLSPEEVSPAMAVPHNLILPVEQSILQLCE